MKFNFIVGNPPYQKNTILNQKGSRTHIWDKFVLKSLNILKENGYLCFVHPNNWGYPGKFNKIRSLINNNQITYLKLYNMKQTKELFNITGCVGWYIFEKTNNYKKTLICDSENITKEYNIKDLPAIPHSKIDEIVKLFASSEKVKFIHSSSAYEHRYKWTSSEKTNEFIYPIVYTLSKSGKNKIWWSSRNDNGHFGIPKVIWSNGAGTDIIIDETGEYGMTQWAYAISDKPENLPLIKKQWNQISL